MAQWKYHQPLKSLFLAVIVGKRVLRITSTISLQQECSKSTSTVHIPTFPVCSNIKQYRLSSIVKTWHRSKKQPVLACSLPSRKHCAPATLPCCGQSLLFLVLLWQMLTWQWFFYGPLCWEGSLDEIRAQVHIGLNWRADLSQSCPTRHPYLAMLVGFCGCL